MGLLNKKIFSGDGVFGLDLSDLSVKVVELAASGGKHEVHSFSSVAIAPGAIVDGEIQKTDLVIEAIKKCVNLAGPKKIKTKKVVCSLPETKAFLRIITIPQMEGSEIQEAVKWEMEANIPLPLDQVYYDWQILEKNITGEKGKIDLLVVAVACSTVDQILGVLSQAELEPVGLDIESIAQSRSLLSEKNAQGSTLVVDIGDRRTSFVIANDGVPCFTSSIPLSGTTLTDSIAKSLGMTFEEAEKTKIAYGIGDDYKNDTIFRAAQPVLENLVTEIEKSMDFYLSGLHYSGDIEKIVVCGGGSNTKGLVPYLSKRLNRTIVLGSPWVNLDLGKKLPPIERDVASQYATAIGLAYKGLEYEDLY